MAREIIRRGSESAPNDFTLPRDSWWEAAGKINNMTTELYSFSSDTISAGWAEFSAGATVEARIALADAACVSQGKSLLHIPLSMIPYDITLCPASAGVRRFREGGNSGVYDVWAYGADPTGVSQSAPAFNAAIDAAEVGLGGTVDIPPGDYLINATITVEASGVILQGHAAYYNVDVGSVDRGSRLRWDGAAGGTIVKFSPVQGASAQAIKRGGISRISIRGTGIAGTGLRIESVQGGVFEQIFIQDTTIVGLDTNTVATLGENRGVTRCSFRDISIRQVNTSGIGMRLDGSDISANTSNNNFDMIAILHANGVGVKMLNSDGNRFYGLNVNRTAAGTGIGIELHGSNTAELHSRANAFFWVSPGDGGLTSYGAGLTAPAEENCAYYYSLENGESLPTIEAGSSFWYTTQRHPTRELEIALVVSSTFTNAPAGDNEWNSDVTYRAKADLSAYSQARLCVPVAVAGAAGSTVRVQYSTNNGSSFAGNLDGSSGPTVTIASAAMQDSGWFNITSAARINNCVLRLLSTGGDGAADPKISARLYVR